MWYDNSEQLSGSYAENPQFGWQKLPEQRKSDIFFATNTPGCHRKHVSQRKVFRAANGENIVGNSPEKGDNTMKLKENLKRFWTLDVHNHEGFTLVELIIVIAILAILSTGAIAGYSAYVERANKTADQALVSEVANALTLYYYSEGNEDTVAFVVVAPDGVTVSKYANDIGTAAMQAAFGSNWPSNMVLKFNQWKDNGLLGAGMTGGGAVLGSSFLANQTPGELLGEVTGVIGTTVEFLTSKGYVGEELYGKMVENMDEATMLEACTKMGLPVVYDEDGNAVSFGESVTDEQLANLMVFVASQEYLDSVSNETEPSAAGMIMYQYTNYMAAANSSYGSEKMKSDLEASLQGESVPAIVTKLSDFAEKYKTELDDYSSDPNETGEAGVDSNAIVNMLGAVNQVSGKVTADDLKDANFFESGVVSSHMNTYLAAAELVTELGTIPEGAIVIFLYDGQVSCTCSELLG